jgi:hypothetical protein
VRPEVALEDRDQHRAVDDHGFGQGRHGVLLFAWWLVPW